jgi:hypothetical protein
MMTQEENALLDTPQILQMGCFNKEDLLRSMLMEEEAQRMVGRINIQIVVVRKDLFCLDLIQNSGR